jgi:hypothetical protein
VKSNGSVLNSYLYLGEYDKFLRSLPEASDSSFILFYRGLGEYYQHNLQLAAKDFDQAYAMEVSLYTQIGKALSASMIHREMDGLQTLHALKSRIAERGVAIPKRLTKLPRPMLSSEIKPLLSAFFGAVSNLVSFAIPTSQPIRS